MNITIKEVEAVTVLKFEGNLDTNTASEAESRINELLEGGAGKLVADFTALDYVSSAGLRVLLATAKKLGAKGERLSLQFCKIRLVQKLLGN